MPVCNNCGKKFRNRIKIDGKIRNMSRRKYCLFCSPFGSKNTKKLEKYDLKTGKRHCVCKNCNKKYVYKRHFGCTTNICNSCCQLLRRRRMKKKAIDYLGGKCIICGYNRCDMALDFHHVDGKTKKFTISGSHCRSWESVKEELDKCVLVCCRCHKEEQAGIINIKEGSLAQSGKSN